MAFAGSVVENGHAKGLVVFVGTQTEIGKIAESIRDTKKEMTPLQKNIQSVGKVIVPVLSEQITSQEPSVSTACIRLTIAFCLDKLPIPTVFQELPKILLIHKESL